MERDGMDRDGEAMAPGGVVGSGAWPEPDRAERDPSDLVVRALIGLEETLERNVAAEQALSAQVRQLRARHQQGLSWREAMDGPTESSGVLPLLGDLLTRLTDAGAVLRRVLAAALLEEGASTAEVAQRFGVSRQRVFRLLRGTDRVVSG